MSQPSTDWADRWLGGFCTVGALGGLPVRGPNYAAHPPLEQQLILPPDRSLPYTDPVTLQTAWSEALGNLPVVVCASVDQARTLLLRALGVMPGEPVGLPANATRSLTEAVKHYPAKPRWIDLDPLLGLHATPDQLEGVRTVWQQPHGGAWNGRGVDGVVMLVDASDSLPSLRPAMAGVTATIYGLHLTTDPGQSGALIVCHEPNLFLALAAHGGSQKLPDPGRAMAQLIRLCGPTGLIARQQAALDAVTVGLNQAAGLPLLQTAPDTLATQIALRVPEPCDAATFYAYVLGEQTPVRWLPALRPLHYAVLRRTGSPNVQMSASYLSRILLIPVGPDYTEEEIRHAVLGVTKAADYLGVRWTTDPHRANWYAELMDSWYGPDHDAFRINL